MSIQKEFVLRYRDNGHARFQIPQRLCNQQIAGLLTAGIANIQGVHSVTLFRRQNKLAIRFNAAACNFPSLAKQLFQVLAELEQQGHLDASAVPALSKSKRPGLKQRFANSGIKRWFGDKYQAVKETAQAAKILGKLSTKGPKALIRDPEKATIDFLNDILALYLIKAHWTRITQEWLVRPLAYRYEWLAAFYLFFLLVRSRRKK